MPGGSYEFKDDEYPFSREGGTPDAGRGTQTAYAAKSERSLQNPDPDPQDPDLTGRYFHDAGKGIPSWYVHVNQAGVHLEVLVVRNLSGLDEDLASRSSHELRHLLGDLEDGVAELYDFKDWNKQAGSIDVEGGKVTLTTAGGEVMPLTRFSRQPTFFPHALADAPAWVTSLEWFPVLSGQRDAFLHQLKRILDFHLEKFFTFDGSVIAEEKARSDRIDLLNKNIATLFSPSADNNYAIQADDLAAYRSLALEFVHKGKAEFSAKFGRDTYAAYLRRAIQAAVKKGFLETHYGHLRRWLDVGPEEGLKFTASLSMGGVNIPTPLIWLGGKVYGGTLSLAARTLAMKDEDEPLWEYDYTVGFIGVSASKSVGKAPVEFFSTGGSGQSDYAWKPSEVEGWFELGDGSVSGSAVLGGGVGGTVMIINGPDSVPRPLILNLSGSFVKAGIVPSVAGSAEASACVGYIFDRDAKKQSRPKPYEIKREEPYEKDVGAFGGSVHFALGSALVEEDGARLLRILAALELPAFLDDHHTRLSITAHTDRVDTWSRNLELSYYRANNVRRALQAILDRKLRIKSGAPKASRLTAKGVEDGNSGVRDLDWTGELQVGNLTLRWLGELEAFRKGSEDRKEDVTFRRVDVVLNNRLVLRLSG